ncbi:MAG: SMC-Scp complex subunit ScpB [Candidatus Methylomirabilota bacterium]
MDENQSAQSDQPAAGALEIPPPDQTLSRQGILEALLFVVDEPISLAKLREILGDAEEAETADSLRELTLDLERRGLGLMVQEVAGGYRLTTRPEAHPWIQRLQQVKPARLSRAALETLAIIAYRQPITKAEVEQIRGVAIDGVLRTLLERELVRILGRKADAGRPILYGTSQEFLEYFGFRALGELPSLREIDELVGPPPAENGAPLSSAADLSGRSRGLFEIETPSAESVEPTPESERDANAEITDPEEFPDTGAADETEAPPAA